MGEMLKLDEYAGKWGVHPNTVHKWLRDGRIVGEKVGKGWRIDAEARPVKKGEKVEAVIAPGRVGEQADPLAGKRQKITELDLDIQIEEKEDKLQKLRGLRPENLEAVREALEQEKTDYHKKLKTLATTETRLNERREKLDSDRDALEAEKQRLGAFLKKADKVRLWCVYSVNAMTHNPGWVKENAEEFPMDIDKFIAWQEMSWQGDSKEKPKRSRTRKPKQTDSQFDD